MRRNRGAVHLLRLVLAIVVIGMALAPNAAAQPPLRLTGYLTDNAGALSTAQRAEVQSAVDQLYDARRIRLWVVYVETFSGQQAQTWARNTQSISDLQNSDAILAVATTDRAYAFLVSPAAGDGVDADAIRRDDIEPRLRAQDWPGAAVAAATALNQPNTAGTVTWVGVLAFVAVVAVLLLGLLLWSRRRKRKRREAEFDAARRLDPADPAALAALHLDALDDLSKAVVVDVDNAVRTSENELALAVEEFGDRDTAPFTTAVRAAKTTLAQAFTVRQTLDDAIPETPQQRRDLLTTGDRAGAADRLRAAHSTAVALGARPLRERLEELARRGRLDAGLPGVRLVEPSAVFTPREAEVLGLVARGLTNRQVGAELYISDKTVSVHLSRVLAKLGVSGRTEAVAVAAERGLLP